MYIYKYIYVFNLVGIFLSKMTDNIENILLKLLKNDSKYNKLF